jgi:hypothetical protein
MDLNVIFAVAEKMSESDKRVLAILLFVILLIVMIFGYLQKLVGKIMYTQGLQIDTMMYDIIRTRVITDKKTFRREAYRKSQILFLKKAWPSFACLILFVCILYIYGAAIHDVSLSFFVKACNDMWLVLKWPTSRFFGLTLPSDWPTVEKAPDFTFSADKYMSLFIVIGLTVSGIFFLVRCQALCSRSMRVRQLCRTYFSKDLNKISQDHA